MIDRASVQAWLDKYIEAWRTYDRALMESLFTEDAAYRYNPFDEPLQGRDAILSDWLIDPDAPGTWKAEYHPIAVEGNTAVTQGRTQYYAEDGSPANAFDNIFVLRFDDATGRVADFCEWYMEPRGQ